MFLKPSNDYYNFLLIQAVFFQDFFAKFLGKTTACFFVLFLSKIADLK
ncbi:hypothetical protein appser12_5550 [Actinobacillus pleuropneumoniae serovar 12 str. 1096]|uniref:Uncharacterized protein n=1 Tax=Actinobacillus pleuropneumoniae serovar 6 str. Femo TaxID=754256 RepID=A0A828PMM9_ACTPL|nr:hypothetical protein appser2_5070 [Actinobacillus pleuropneumoniae serovar 2 str. S1536]EFM90327.1 hypothetical protein appser4_5450 [Actinobacillus pleuropneumoniae serovar 4 str. M62]EFM92413.1 hypothetical protein appser6_6170 [Actinobacillus pleuropneumoniae serovar 6 str. Femo]EFM96870.1 hypothetical protein appser10_5630 [Actinobacillus pleuropneumoniae serovar 10 str. D13039]EFN01085.1 hypothetical protein appser12_5550 [Actinobacillus pleuropneumoniae serovar 12 str. 1096]EFN03258.1